METHILNVQRSARYHSMGVPGPHTRLVLLALHGYAQSALQLMEQLQPVCNNETWVVAPEGLSRFYAKGFYGEVVSSWMTKEIRTHDIADNIAYLTHLYAHLQLHQLPQAQVVALGFSQGTSTLSRWLHAFTGRVDKAIFCAGEIAAELMPLPTHSGLRQCNKYFMYGQRDELIPATQSAAVAHQLEADGYHILPFDDGHVLHMPTLKTILA